jgi:hypothetical protein
LVAHIRFSEIAPWIQGLFGGGAVTLLWELGLKPAREKRALAIGLGAEVSCNLHTVALAKSALRNQPNTIPRDFCVATLTFTAVAPVIGLLGASLVSQLTALYIRFTALNALRERWGTVMDEYRSLSGEQVGPRTRCERELEEMRGVYRVALSETLDLANASLPGLRKAARRWFMRWRRGRLTPMADIDKAVDDMAVKIATASRPP